MAGASKSSSPLTALGSQSRRRTRASLFVDELTHPPAIRRTLETRRGVTHAAAIFVARDATWWCCRRDRDEDMTTTPGEVVTCLTCAQCKGCPACRDNHVTMRSLEMGKWETKDRRKLYPFEMDNQHLVNAIAKLHRDKDAFKRHWKEWLVVLEDEAKGRGLR